MIRTKFVVEELDDLFHLWTEFEDKLTKWADTNPNTSWEIDTLVTTDSFEIIVTVRDETADHDKGG